MAHPDLPPPGDQRGGVRERWATVLFVIAGVAALVLVMPLAMVVPAVYAVSLVPFVALVGVIWWLHPRSTLSGRAASFRGGLWLVLVPAVLLYWASLVSLRWFSPLVGDVFVLLACHLAAGFLIGSAIDDLRGSWGKRR